MSGFRFYVRPGVWFRAFTGLLIYGWTLCSAWGAGANMPWEAPLQSILDSVDPGADLLSQAQIQRVMTFFTELNLPFTDQIQSWLIGAASQAASAMAQFALGLGASIPDLISRFFIFLGIVGTLLPNYHPFVQRLRRLSPLDDQVDNIFLHRIKLKVRSMFLVIFVIAVAQGLVTGLLFWIAGVPGSADIVKVEVPSAIAAGISRRGRAAERTSASAIGASTKNATKRLTPP